MYDYDINLISLLETNFNLDSFNWLILSLTSFLLDQKIFSQIGGQFKPSSVGYNLLIIYIDFRIIY